MQSISANPGIETVQLYAQQKHANIIFQLTPQQRALAVVSLPMHHPNNKTVVPLGIGQTLRVSVVNGSVEAESQSSAPLMKITPKSKRSSSSVDSVILKSASGELFKINPANLGFDANEAGSDQTSRFHHVGALSTQWSDLIPTDEEPYTDAPVVHIELVEPESQLLLSELKKRVASCRSQRQPKYVVLENSFTEIKKFLAVTEFGGLRYELLNNRQMMPYDRGVARELPSSFNALRANRDFFNTMKKIESGDHFLVSFGSARAHNANRIQMLDHLAGTHLFNTPGGQRRLSQQMGFILTVYNRCPEHGKNIIEDILLDVMRRCVDRAQRQMATAVFKTAVVASSIGMISNDQLADVFVGLFKEFLIDQVAISNDNLWASTTNRGGYGRLSEGGFSDESVEDALALRKSLSNVLKLGEEAGLQHRGCVAMSPQQHAEALAEICFHFCSVESFEMFAHEQQEAVELLLQTLLPIYAQRVSAVRDELDTLADYLDESGFEDMLAAYLEHNGFSEFEFDPDNKYGFYGHVDQHLKLAGELSIIVIAKTLSDANYLCGNASQKIPYLDQVAGIRDIDQYQAALESIALKAIPWLIQPAVQPFDEPKTEQKCGVKRQSESPEPVSNKQPRVALTDDDMSDALL